MKDNLQFSEWLYSVLLRLYPQPFRATYGQQMRLTFRDACRTAYHHKGMDGVVALWLPTLLDLFKSVLETWVQQGEIMMSKTRLITWAGPLNILIGLMWMVIPITEFFLRAGLLGNEMLGFIFFSSFVLSFVPMVFALIGTRLRFHHSVSGLGRFGLELSVVSCVCIVILLPVSLLLGSAVPDISPWLWINYAVLICLMSIRIGYILFGIDVLKYRLLTRWNFLPLLLGLTFVLSLPIEWFGVPALLPSDWGNPVLHFILTSVCWMLLGIAMLRPRREAHSTTAI